jgi:Asp-tRNA(Asn)/Glu-tRNA(Gln) amidotransferase B subunit
MLNREKYEAVIGLEVHAQLATESKLFCGDSTAFGAEPNTQISPITLAHPGTLPMTNRKAVEYAIRMGIFPKATRYHNIPHPSAREVMYASVQREEKEIYN